MGEVVQFPVRERIGAAWKDTQIGAYSGVSGLSILIGVNVTNGSSGAKQVSSPATDPFLTYLRHWAVIGAMTRATAMYFYQQYEGELCKPSK